MQSDFFTSLKMNFHRVYLDKSFNKALNSCRFKRYDKDKDKSLNHLDLKFSGFDDFGGLGGLGDFDKELNDDISVRLFADVKLDVKTNDSKSKQNNSKPKDFKDVYYEAFGPKSNSDSPWKFDNKKSNPFGDCCTNNKCDSCNISRSSSRPIYVGFPSDVKPESLSSCLKTNFSQSNVKKEEMQKVNDNDFIKFCETKLNTGLNTFTAAKELRAKMRAALESNVDEETLKDFKTLVNITDNPSINAEKMSTMTTLLCKYVNKFN